MILFSGELESSAVFRMVDLVCNFLDSGFLKEAIVLREALVQEV